MTNPRSIKPTRLHVVLAILVAAVLVTFAPHQAQAEKRAVMGRHIFRGGIVGPAMMPRMAPPTTAAGSEDPSEGQFPGGAALKTDPEQQRLLQRAQQCVADGRPDLAAVLWQKVLDEAGDTLMTRDGRTYLSLASEVERTLATLDAAALKTYRITADAEAQAVLAKAAGGSDEAAMAEVVRRYFVSSVGDDAAYKLACIALDRQDFIGAGRLLAKIVERHPDPSIPPAEIQLRLAVASGMMGDRKAAAAALRSAESAAGPRPNRELVSLVNSQIQAAAKSPSQAASGDWPMALGGRKRDGHMRSLPSEATERTLTELWMKDLAVVSGGRSVNNPWGGAGVPVEVLGRRSSAGKPALQSVSRDTVVEHWRQFGWRPTPQLLFHEGKVFIKSADDLAAYNSAAITDSPIWQTFGTNRYATDAMSQTLMMLTMQLAQNNPGARGERPQTAAEIMMFGDRVHQGMSIEDDVVYSIEGRRIANPNDPEPANSTGFQWGVMPRRTRTNWLAAYEAKSGKAKWQRSASDEDKEGSQDVGFLAAPVAVNSKLVLAPVTDGGTIWLYGINSEDGTTAWKSYLCDEPVGGCSPWSPVYVAVDGRDAYLTCGAGVVFAVNAVSGTIRWAARYARDGEPNRSFAQMYGQQMSTMLTLKGWDDDLVIPHGRALVVMASDSNQLFALDRRTGDFLWQSPREDEKANVPVLNYCVGVHGENLYVAGKNVVRAYDIPSGRSIWDPHEIEDSFGRGIVTEDAVYIPVRDSVLKLDLAKGNELAQVGVSLTSDDPVGNLYSDGEKLWVTGGGRVYAMTNLEQRFAMLEKEIAAGDVDAQYNRMRLFWRQNKTDRAVSDLCGAYALSLREESRDAATAKLLAAIAEIKLPQRDAAASLLIAAKLLPPASAAELSSDGKQRLIDFLSSTLYLVRQQHAAKGAKAVLQVAELCNHDYLLSNAAQTLTAVAGEADLDLLRKAVEGDSPNGQAIAIAKFAELSPDTAAPLLKSRLASDDDRVRLAAARALLNLKDRSALGTLVELLASPQPRIRARSHQTLRSVTGQQIAFVSEASDQERAKAIATWKKWIDDAGATAKLKLPLADGDAPLGRTLIASHGNSVLIELDAEFKERWRTSVQNPWGCEGLPNGNRLVASYSSNAVIEYDAEGKEIWKKELLPSPPNSVQRLENGSTLVACPDAQKIIELGADGSLRSLTLQGRPMHARRLENGHTLVALQQDSRVVELDAADKIVWEARNLSGPAFAQRLENGNTLVVQIFNGQVVEIDPSGQKQVWVCNVSLANPTAAIRLSNGNTLIADNRGLHEVDAEGKREVRQFQQTNVTGMSQF